VREKHVTDDMHAVLNNSMVCGNRQCICQFDNSRERVPYTSLKGGRKHPGRSCETVLGVAESTSGWVCDTAVVVTLPNGDTYEIRHSDISQAVTADDTPVLQIKVLDLDQRRVLMKPEK
jgi:hypothetical protein